MKAIVLTTLFSILFITTAFTQVFKANSYTKLSPNCLNCKTIQHVKNTELKITIDETVKQISIEDSTTTNYVKSYVQYSKVIKEEYTTKYIQYFESGEKFTEVNIIEKQNLILIEIITYAPDGVTLGQSITTSIVRAN